MLFQKREPRVEVPVSDLLPTPADGRAGGNGTDMDLISALEGLVDELKSGLGQASLLDELEKLRVDFLGRKGTALPKYYREVAENPAEGQASTRKGGVWTQFTAIVIPNDAAVAGVESELDGKTASSKGFDMAFDEAVVYIVV